MYSNLWRGWWLIKIFKCQIWVQPEMNLRTTSIGYSKWDISISKWDMPIIACDATMAEPLRCVPLPLRLWHALYFQTTSCSGIAAIMDSLQFARRYQNSSVRESQESSSVCQCHDIIMSMRRTALFHISLEKWTIWTRPPARCLTGM